MAREEQIIIEVQINTDEAKAKLVDVTSKIGALKNENANLKKELKDLNKDYANNSKAIADINLKIAENNNNIKTLTVSEKVLQQQLIGLTESNYELGDSYKEEAKLLANLKEQYSSLSKEQQKTEGGKALKAQIDELDKSVKENSKSIGNNQVFVGEYERAYKEESKLLANLIEQYSSLSKEQQKTEGGNALKAQIDELDKSVKENSKSIGNNQVIVAEYERGLGKFGQILNGVNSIFSGGFSNAIKTADTQVITFGKTLLTTPIGWIAALVGVLIAAFQRLQQAFKNNDEASTRLDQAMAQLKPIGEAISWVFDKLAVIISKLIQGFMGVVTWALKLIPAYKNAAKETENLVLQQDRLEESQRNFTLNQAFREKEIARINKEVLNAEKYIAEERERMLQRADDLAKKNLEEKRFIAKQEYDIFVKKAKEEKKTDDETMKRKAELWANIQKAETEYYEGTRRIESRHQSALEEIRNNEIEKEKERNEKRKELLENRKEQKQKEIDFFRLAEDKMIALMQDGAEKQKKQLEIQSQREIADLNYKLATEKNLTENAKENIRNAIKAINEKFSIDLKAIDDKITEDAIKAETERQQALIEATIKAEEERQQRLLSDNEKKNLILENFYNEQKNILFGKETELANLELQQKQQQYDNLINLDAETKKALYENEEQYKDAVIASEAEILAAKQRVQDQSVQDIENFKQQFDAISGGLKDVLNSIAGDDEDMTKFVKAVAIAQSAANLGLAISKAVAAGASNPVTLAVNVGAVFTAMAGVISSIKEIQEPDAPTFATGGIVGGTSYYGDAVTAKVNSGEMILNAEQQKRLFDLISVSGNFSTGFDYELLAKAISEQPAPVLVYKEFENFQQKIVTFDEQIKI